MFRANIISHRQLISNILYTVSEGHFILKSKSQSIIIGIPRMAIAAYIIAHNISITHKSMPISIIFYSIVIKPFSVRHSPIISFSQLSAWHAFFNKSLYLYESNSQLSCFTCTPHSMHSINYMYFQVSSNTITNIYFIVEAHTTPHRHIATLYILPIFLRIKRTNCISVFIN